ncbi:hypothetical protein BgiMline_002808, partial [Biomphalaria glabrata]
MHAHAEVIEFESNLLSDKSSSGQSVAGELTRLLLLSRNSTLRSAVFPPECSG